MKSTLVPILVLILASLAAADETGSLVLRGGKIVTVDEDFRIVEAMAVRDGRVIATGTDKDVAPLIDATTRVVELDGRMVLPGLIDSHVHPSGASRYEADHEIPPMDTIDDVIAYVRRRAKVVPEGEWITLSQVFITRLKEQRYPTRAELDDAAPNHPVFFRTGPDASANTLALRENGIDREFARKHPDQVLVDPASGEPNGLLRQAGSILKTRPNSNRKSLTEAESDDRLVALFDDYNRWGITGVIDRNCNDASRSQYARLLKANRLNLRVRMSRSLSPGGDLESIQQRLDDIAGDLYFTSPDPRLGVIGVKVFEDGGMLTGSAFFKRPWGLSTIYGIEDPRYRGMQYIDEDRLESLVRACAKRNLAFTAHCQGDAAVEALVRAYARVNEEIPIGATRSSITHSSFMSDTAIQGAAKLGIGVDLQPAWLYLDARTLVAQFGQQRLKYFIPLRSLLEAGVVAGGGSDHMQKIGSLRSVNPYNPFLGMWIAVTRQARWHDGPIHPEQSLSREQMIRFYTINNAWLMRAEDEIGSLEAGKRADFVVIDRDLLTCSDDEIRETTVVSTWLDGAKIFDSDTQQSTDTGGEFKQLFDGATLDGWHGDPDHWSVKDGAIIGSTKPDGRISNTFLIADGNYSDFVLRVKFKYTTGGSGIQIRSRILGDADEFLVTGYQADIGGGDLGTFYEEKGRGNLVKSNFSELEPFVHKGEWNQYEIRAIGNDFELKVNGRVTARYTETEIETPRSGLVALQLQAGAGMEIAFKEIEIREITP